MKTVYIYCLQDPETDAVRYVGKTIDPRERDYGHKYYLDGTTHKICWIKSLLAHGLTPKLIILKTLPDCDKKTWREWERRYIRCAKTLGFALTNATNGGDGFGGGEEHPNFGKTPPSESRQAQSERMKGEKNPMFGKKGAAHPAFDYQYSAEQRKRRSHAKLGKKLTTNTSGFSGVTWCKSHKRWRAIHVKKHYLGYFKKIEDAVFARAIGVCLYGA